MAYLLTVRPALLASRVPLRAFSRANSTSLWLRVLASARQRFISSTSRRLRIFALPQTCFAARARSEEHTSELQSLMRISYAVFCLKKKKEAYTIHNKMPANYNKSARKTYHHIVQINT